MSCYALYRFPYERTAWQVAQTSGETELLFSYADIGHKRGFVIAPFSVAKDRPIVLMRPDDVRMIGIPATDEVDIGRVRTINGEEERRAYSHDFQLFRSRLEAGEFNKIVLSRCSRVETENETDAKRLFFRACRMYPRQFVALVSAPSCGIWLMATPEALLRGSGHEWTTMALAGTMRYADNVEWSSKNRREQRYVADYIEHCLRRFADKVEATAPHTVRAGNLVHLRTDFRFALADEAKLGQLINELHPTPAVCGMPKQLTHDFIMTHESASRDYYSGFLGPIGINSSTDLFVALRCMRIAGRECRLYAGGGLLAESREEDEWRETEAKLEAMREIFTTTENTDVQQ